MKNNLNKLPTIIDELGQYKTRSNKIVVINKIRPSSNSDKLEFNCIAMTYNTKGDIISTKSWHNSGRVSQYSTSPIDIVEKID